MKVKLKKNDIFHTFKSNPLFEQKYFKTMTSCSSLFNKHSDEVESIYVQEK